MSRAILKNISVSGTVRRLRRCLLLTSFVAMASALLPLFAPSLAQAADTLPGDACTGAELNHIRSNAGKASDGTSYNLVYCNGTNWVGMLSGDATGIKVPSSAALTGDISDSITAAQNDYSPTGLSTATVLRLSTDASRDITGLAGGADGRTLVILNVGSNPLVLKNQSTSSTAANRFALGADLTLAADQGTSLIYDSTSQRWRAGALPFSSAGGGGGGFVGSAACTPTANNPQYVETNSSSGSYTLTNYAVPSLSDRTLVVTFHVDNGQSPTYVTFGGVPLTKATEGTFGSARSAIWYLVNPSVSTADIVATMSNFPARAAITAVTLDCTNQTLPPTTASEVSSSTTTSTSINTWFENSMIVDAITINDPGPGAPTVTQGPDQVAIRSANSIGGGTTAYGSSTKLAASASLSALGWSNLLADVQAHELVAFLPVMTGGSGFGSAYCTPTANNPQYVESNVSGTTYSLTNYVVPSLTNRTLVVTAQLDGGQNPYRVTFGGTHYLTKATEGNNGAARSSIWYLVDPPVGMGDIVTEGTSIPHRAAITAVTLDCTHQTQPPFIASKASGSTTINTSINTFVENMMIVDSLTIDNPGPGAPTVTAGPDQVAIRSANSIGGGTTAYGSSTKLAASVGSSPLGWSNLLAINQMHELAAFFPVMSSGGGGIGGCTAPTGCTTAGSTCADGSRFAGFVLTDDASTCRVVFATDTNQSSGAWGPTGIVTGVTSFNEGYTNQAWIVANTTLSNYPAFETCENLSRHSNGDWYLPSVRELMLLYKAGIITTNSYWSSSELDAWQNDNYAHSLDANYGSGYSYNTKNSTEQVRCVRSVVP